MATGHGGAHGDLSSCASSACVRCSQYSRVRSGVAARWWRDVADDMRTARLGRAVESIATRATTTTADRSRSATAPTAAGDGGDDAAGLGQPEEYVVFVPELNMQPWYESWGRRSDACQPIRDAIAASGLTTDAVLDAIRGEFAEAWNSADAAWTFNSTGGGDGHGWKTLPLVNQGEERAGNQRLMATAAAAVRRLGAARLDGCALGNACVSALEPGARIAAHRGPCNVRVRCHVPLFAPAGPWLRVGGGAPRTWHADGTAYLLFNDAFEHEVAYDHDDGSGGDGGARVVLLVDLWHPELTADERQALRVLFPPPSSLPDDGDDDKALLT